MTLAHEPDHEAALGDMVRAGVSGLELGTEIDAGIALHFGALGLASITNAKAPPQRAVATGQARALNYRSTW